nr:MAG TPA: hypothetical protein [Caudoviricetes sp.]
MKNEKVTTRFRELSPFLYIGIKVNICRIKERYFPLIRSYSRI